MNYKTKNQIIRIINSADGMNIGTSLANYLEDNIGAILPLGYTYNFYWNMSGEIQHIFNPPIEIEIV